MQDEKKPTQVAIVLTIIKVFSTSNLNPNLWRPENYISHITANIIVSDFRSSWVHCSK